MASIYVEFVETLHNGETVSHGDWVSVEEYESFEEFMDRSKEELSIDDDDSNDDSNDDTIIDYEFKSTDYEGIPAFLRPDTTDLDEDDYERIRKYVESGYEDMLDDEKLQQYNEFCESNNYTDDYIYHYDNNFFEEHFSSITEAVDAALFGEVNRNHSYIRYDHQGNLESFENAYSALKEIDEKEVIEWLIDNL